MKATRGGAGVEAEGGYTLVELVVGMTLVLLVGGLLGTAYVWAVRWVTQWQEVVRLENNAHLVLQRLVWDLAYAEAVVPGAPGQWVIRHAPGQEVRYVHDAAAGVLRRGGVVMHDASLHVGHLDLVLQERAAHPGETNWHPARVHVALTLRTARRSLALTTAVTLRQRPTWHEDAGM